jgi:hypothetical protein
MEEETNHGRNAILAIVALFLMFWLSSRYEAEDRARDKETTAEPNLLLLQMTPKQEEELFEQIDSIEAHVDSLLNSNPNYVAFEKKIDRIFESDSTWKAYLDSVTKQ